MLELKAFPRRVRKRTVAYTQLLRSKRPNFTWQHKTTQEEDALLAEVLIREYSPLLHSFLYEGMVDGHINPKALRLLLTSPMDEPSIAKDGMMHAFFINGGPDSHDLLKHVFRYDVFSAREEIHEFIRLLGAEVCPYCNRLYITTARCSKYASPVRPELDHYRSKSKYPFFALSILNLVPSCSVCNHIKSNITQEILYPYVEEMGEDYHFRTELRIGISYLTGAHLSHSDYNLTLKQMNPGISSAKKERIANSIKCLQLESLYSSHREYVSDIIFQRYIFTDSMIQDIIRQFPSLFRNEKEVRSMLLMMNPEKENWGKRPLAKLTHDISVELDELYAAVKRK